MIHRPYNLVLLGPPGAGKSTLSDMLVQRLPLAVIATGRRLRQEIAAESVIGRQIAPLLEQGHFAPDELMSSLMSEWLAGVPADHGFLLDGYPRSLPQALALEGMLAHIRRPLDAVIALELDETAALHRLGGRRSCRGGGETFILHIDDAAALQRCRERGGTLAQRDDDHPAIIAERLRVYARETEPLIDLFRERGLLREVDADGTPAEVTDRLLAAFADSGYNPLETTPLPEGS